MPLGKGWFIDTRTGEVIPVWEHATAVRENPSRYRVRPDEIEGHDREAILRLVLARGFVRARWDRHGVVFEFHGNRGRALRLIRRMLRAEEAGPLTVVKIHDLANGESSTGYAKVRGAVVGNARNQGEKGSSHD